MTTPSSAHKDNHVASTRTLTEDAVRCAFGVPSSASSPAPMGNYTAMTHGTTAYNNSKSDRGGVHGNTRHGVTRGHGSAEKVHEDGSVDNGSSSSCVLVKPAPRNVSDAASVCSTVQSVLPLDPYQRLLYRPRRHLLQCTVTRIRGNGNNSSDNGSSTNVLRSWLHRLRRDDCVDCFALEQTRETLLCAVTGDGARTGVLPHKALSWPVTSVCDGRAACHCVLRNVVPVALLCRAAAVVASRSDAGMLVSSSLCTATPAAVPQTSSTSTAMTTPKTSFARLLAGELAARDATATATSSALLPSDSLSRQHSDGDDAAVWGIVCRCADKNTFVLLGKRNNNNSSGSGADVRRELGVLWFSEDGEGRSCVTVVLPAAHTAEVAHAAHDTAAAAAAAHTSGQATAPVVDEGSALLREYTRDAHSAALCVLYTRPPQWDHATRTFRLSQHTRVRVASEKNVELVCLDRASSSAAADDASRLVMSFGKHGDDRFVMDFRQPLCGLQAAFVATALLHRRDFAFV